MKTETGDVGETVAREACGSWLVQRLDPPWPASEAFGPDNPFAFGGGLHNGGLSDEAMGLLRGVFRFDYMGAAEFEFGAVPKALSRIAQSADEFVAFTFTFPLKDVRKHWRDKSRKPPLGDVEVHVLCHRGITSTVCERIKGWAAGDGRLKEGTRLPDVLRPDPESDYRPTTCGWLELDNGFFFFTDAVMWQRTCDLFGVPTHRADTPSSTSQSGREAEQR